MLVLAAWLSIVAAGQAWGWAEEQAPLECQSHAKREVAFHPGKTPLIWVKLPLVEVRLVRIEVGERGETRTDLTVTWRISNEDYCIDMRMTTDYLGPQDFRVAGSDGRGHYRRGTREDGRAMSVDNRLLDSLEKLRVEICADLLDECPAPQVRIAE